MGTQPRGTGPKWGTQWSEPTMAAAYAARHPWPEETFDVVAALAGSDGPVLEIGAGSGRFTYGLADRVGAVDAVEPSPAMVASAVTAQGAHPCVRWTVSSFEHAVLRGPYAMAVAAESIHWLDWPVAFPKLSSVLDDGAPLVLLSLLEYEPGASRPGARPWTPAALEVIADFSVNHEFEPYDLMGWLRDGGWFEEQGQHRTATVAVEEPIERVVERFHSMNGLAPASLGERTAEFDRRMRAVLEPYATDGVLRTDIGAGIRWGRALPGPGGPRS